MSIDFYKTFEDKYRGSRELIKSRQRVYLSFIEPLLSLYKDVKAIDLGCGRGEWLELLKESGFNGQGVDLDDGMLKICYDHGMIVSKQDAISALQALPDESQLVVSGFHIAEHIQFSDLQLLVQESFRVLKPGGLLILETPNPENILVGTANFYIDPTHQRPIPPQLLFFLTDYYGFVRNKIIRLQEDKSLEEKEWFSLLDVLSGVSPDYAVVAQKNAGESLLNCTRDAFAREYGITLNFLVNKFDQQSKLTAENAAQAEKTIKAIYASRSWKVTAPARWLNMKIRQLRKDVLIGKFKRVVKKYVEFFVRKVVISLNDRPVLRTFCVVIIKKIKLYKHLRTFLTKFSMLNQSDLNLGKVQLASLAMMNEIELKIKNTDLKMSVVHLEMQ